jgi:hypothetical protein
MLGELGLHPGAALRLCCCRSRRCRVRGHRPGPLGGRAGGGSWIEQRKVRSWRMGEMRTRIELEGGRDGDGEWDVREGLWRKVLLVCWGAAMGTKRRKWAKRWQTRRGTICPRPVLVARGFGCRKQHSR